MTWTASQRRWLGSTMWRRWICSTTSCRCARFVGCLPGVLPPTFESAPQPQLAGGPVAQDLSVQKLVVLLAGGGLPALKRLLLSNNKFETTGRTMLKGLAMLRKGLVVKTENELD